MSGPFWGDRGHCPDCGKFCGEITGHFGYTESAYIPGPFLERVTGICKTHGEVDLTKQDWSWEDFDPDNKIEENLAHESKV